jgi:hypothetical protein
VIGRLHPREVVEALGVELIPYTKIRERSQNDRLLPSNCVQIGSAPTWAAWLSTVGNEVAVLCTPGELAADVWMVIIHEALHAVLGPETLETEWPMMPVEWAVAQELGPEWVRPFRQHFADFGFIWTAPRGRYRDSFGHSDEVLGSAEWADACGAAEARGWLDAHGRPTWGSGPHPGYDVWKGQVATVPVPR